MVQVYTIQQKCKADPMEIAKRENFIVAPAGQREPQTVVQDPNVSLYCLDDASRDVIFIETPPGTALLEAPFLWQAQYEHAHRLLVMPYETFFEAAARLPDPAIPLVLIYSVGRSGSTLLSKAFQAVAAVTSLSEPDVFTHLAMLRPPTGERDEELTRLISGAMRMLFTPAGTPAPLLHVVKFRSQALEVADLISAACPAARNLFLYRKIGNYVRSAARAFIPPDFVASPEAMRPIVDVTARYSRLVAAASPELRAALNPLGLLALRWLNDMHRYADLQHGHVSMKALCYEDLVADPAATLQDVFSYLGLSTDLVAQAASAFARDAQEGTVVSQEAIGRRASFAITDQHWPQVHDLLRRYPFAADDLRDLPHLASSTSVLDHH